MVIDRLAVIQEAVQVVLTTRDFCGDEDAAISDVGHDRDIMFTPEEREMIKGLVQAEWLKSKRAAGNWKAMYGFGNRSIRGTRRNSRYARKKARARR